MVKFPDRKRITAAIRQAEEGTSGEIRVHIERWSIRPVLESAKKAFTRLGMHKTRERNGVLIFVSLNRQFAIVGDESIHRKVGDDFWNGTRDAMSARFKDDDVTAGIEEGIRSAGEKLKVYFPKREDDTNELSDNVTGD
jgi:uncharacterized membrane protein